MLLAGDTRAVLDLLRALGFPEPASLRIDEPPHGVLTFRVELDGQPDLLVRAAPATGRDGLRHELAALRLLEAHELPRPSSWSLVPPEASPRARHPVEWAITTAPPGRPVVEVLDRAELVLRAAEDLGLALARTHRATTSPRFGTAADGGHFLPIRGAWRAEVTARAREAHALATAAGCDLGPDLSPLDDAALDEVEGFCLVHRDLRPRNLRIHPDGRIAAWTGWERAVLGDPLLDWASLLLQPPAVVAAVARGYGAERVAELRERGARARLEVYVRWLLLHELALAASPWFDEADRRRAEVVEQVRGWRGTVSAALDALEAPARSVPTWRPDPVAVLARRALRRLALDPAPGPSEVERLLDVLAIAWLADRFPAAAPLLEPAHALLDQLPAGAPAPIPAGGPAALRAGSAGDLLALVGEGTSAVLPLAWLGGWAIDRLGGRVGEGVSRGLEVLGRQVAATDRGQASGARRLFRAARGLGAATALGLPADRLRAATEDAWDVVSGGLRGPPTPPDRLVEALAAAPWPPGRPSLLAALLAAGESALPDTLGALLAHAS